MNKPHITPWGDQWAVFFHSTLYHMGRIVMGEPRLFKTRDEAYGCAKHWTVYGDER